MSNNKVSVIVVTHNSGRHVDNLIKSLAHSKASIERILVIDNQSTDDTLIKLEKFSNLDLIRNTKNHGFAHAVNQGIKELKLDDVVLLNPDTILDKSSITELILAREKYAAGIIGGCCIRKTDKYIHQTFVRFPTAWTILFDYTNLRKLIPGDSFHKKHYYRDEVFPIEPKEVDAVSGAFMLITREVIKKIGYFDENFFMYLEDIDFCHRAKHAGFKIIFSPQANIYHEGGGSSDNADKINHTAWYQSRRYFVSKYFETSQKIVLTAALKTDEFAIELWRKVKYLL